MEGSESVDALEESRLFAGGEGDSKLVEIFLLLSLTGVSSPCFMSLCSNSSEMS